VLADYLTRRGIAVLRVDDRGVGGSTGDRSMATTADYAKDALAGVNFLKAHSRIDPDLIGIIGHSEGGTIAAIAAAKSRDVGYIVMLGAPGLPGEEYNFQFEAAMGRALGQSDETIASRRAIQERVFAILKQDKDRSVKERELRDLYGNLEPPMPQAKIDAAVRWLSSPWVHFNITHEPGATLKNVKCPVLAMIGEKDAHVPPEGNLEAIEAALEGGGNQDYRVEELPGLNHFFQTARTGAPSEYLEIQETLAPAALEAVSGWILEHAN
jgi:pimeloyl-ACP methyl ester carboxylesterase